MEQDTIVAVATPPGRGGLGIVRVSGPEASTVLAPVLRLRSALAPGRARLAAVIDSASADVLDEAVVTFFAAPRSYTGEDVVEIAVHGAPVLLDFLVRSAIAAGARLAEPGEFTQRAFLSGRLDLLQAEAVHDLVASSTLHQARIAAAQLGGSISRAVAPAKEALLNLIAALEAGTDFAEDDLPVEEEAAIAEQLKAVQSPLAVLERSFAYGSVVRSGITLALVGSPNVGKSSLFNRLLERERAIVTADPGTTRDPIAERLAIAGIPVELVDTAGLRDAPEGEAEAEGIRRSRSALADADLVLHVLDATSAVDGQETLRRSGSLRHPDLVVLNKIDLVESRMPSVSGQIFVSARTGEGIDTLRNAIASILTGPAGGQPETTLVTNLRQQQAISLAVSALDKALEALASKIPHEFILLDLHEALALLDTLTGATAHEEILRRIFAGFCIGK